jgi:hypothetical protein
MRDRVVVGLARLLTRARWSRSVRSRTTARSSAPSVGAATGIGAP